MKAQSKNYLKMWVNNMEITEEFKKINKEVWEHGFEKGYNLAIEKAAKIGFEYCQCNVHGRSWQDFASCHAVKAIRGLK